MTKFAAIQMTSSLNVGSNLMQAKDAILSADRQGAKVILLPEHFACFPSKSSDFLGVAESYGSGRIQDFLKTMAQMTESYLIGSVPLLIQEKLVHSLLIMGPEGTVVGRYDRIHRFCGEPSPAFGVMGLEAETVERGPEAEPQVVETPYGRIGLSLGFDSRFPRLYQELRQKGAEVIVVPASFSYALADAHWHILMGARAVDQQVFLVAANQYGMHDNGQESFGESLILDPWGNVLGVMEQGVGPVLAEINLIHLSVLREEFPLADSKNPC
jgi:predicted amidohydrolase